MVVWGARLSTWRPACCVCVHSMYRPLSTQTTSCSVSAMRPPCYFLLEEIVILIGIHGSSVCAQHVSATVHANHRVPLYSCTMAVVCFSAADESWDADW